MTPPATRPREINPTTGAPRRCMVSEPHECRLDAWDASPQARRELREQAEAERRSR